MVAIVLFVFLMNVRATVISLTAIPISILITVLVFQAFGLSINTMTLGGLAIAIGELVDDAVVDVENILRRLRENRAWRRARGRSSRSSPPRARRCAPGILYATIIIVLVFVPLFALSGIEGRLFAPLGIAYIVSILALARHVDHRHAGAVPIICCRAAGRAHEADGFVRAALKRGNAALLRWAFDRRRAVFAAVGGCGAVRPAVAAVSAAAQLPAAVQRRHAAGQRASTIPASRWRNRIGSGFIAERIVVEVPEVRSVGRRTGRAELDEHAEGVHTSELDVDLARSARSKEEIYADIRARLSVLPVSVNIGQPISHRLDHMLSGVRAQIALKIYGDDLDTLRRPRRDAARAARAASPGSSTCRSRSRSCIPQVRIHLDYERAALYGVTPAAITQGARGAVERPPGVADRRRQPPLRRGDAARRTRTARPTGLGDLLIATPTRPRAAALARRDRGDRRPQSDPARERAAPHRRLWQRRRTARHGGDRRRHPPRRGARRTGRKAIRPSSKAPSRRRRRRRCASACCRWSRSR